jgi:D-psicose/D-tagatose/L-ribulose 3-epimerase
MVDPFRHAMCNEAFEGWDFASCCRAIRQAGYSGIEIAPFTLAADPATLSAARRRELAGIIRSEGLHFVGLHWLMVSPAGLHVTTPDDALRARSWEHIRHLVDLCADLGPDGVMVFGSPKQRGTTGGATRAEAIRRFVEGLAAAAPHAESRGVRLLVEALPANQTDVIGSLAEAVAVVNAIASPAIRTMFDTHNAVDETENHATLVDRYFEYINHVHVNETDGRHCGRGSYDFRPVLATLAARAYRGWVSLEAFDFTPGGETIAAESLTYLKTEIGRIAA